MKCCVSTIANDISYNFSSNNFCNILVLARPLCISVGGRFKRFMSYLPLYSLHYSDNIRCVCKGEGVFYLMFWVTVSTLPLYTEPLRVHIVDILNTHVVYNLVDLSKYQHNGASIGLELVCCVHWLSTE